MRNAAVGVQRVIARLRSDKGSRSAAASTFQRQSLSIAHAVRTGSAGRPRPAGERLVSITAVGLVAVALVISNLGTDVSAGPTGGTNGAGSEPRIALGGAVAGIQDAPLGGTDDGPTWAGDATEIGLDSSNLSALGLGGAPDDRVTIGGPFASDGTLVKPISVDTSVADGKELMRSYRVRSGDTLTGIANRFDVSMMTVWWANNLTSKDDLHIGQILTIPPVSGVVVTVSVTDTLDALATKYAVDPSDIVAINELDDPVLVVGQTLTIPGARANAIATPKPKPTAAPTKAPTRSSGSGGSTRPPATYSGGKFAWPVAGGYISQGYHYGHYGIDIAADRGTRVKAAGGGTVTFAGWKNNGGGYQVWIAHGSNLYTTYNHMSSVSVGRGQHVSRGQQVGRVGATGNATGPHLHFEVWRGPIWNGGTRMNPLSYL